MTRTRNLQLLKIVRWHTENKNDGSSFGKGSHLQVLAIHAQQLCVPPARNVTDLPHCRLQHVPLVDCSCATGDEPNRCNQSAFSSLLLCKSHRTKHEAAQSIVSVSGDGQIRLQLQGQGQAKSVREYAGFLRGMRHVVENEGVTGLYKGLSPAILREASYSAIRLGLYEPAKELLGFHDVSNTPLWAKVAAGAMTGAVGSAIANPTGATRSFSIRNVYFFHQSLSRVVCVICS